MLANYTVLLTTVPPTALERSPSRSPLPPLRCSSGGPSSETSPLAATSGLSEAAVPSAAATAAIAKPAGAFGDEADVRDALVDRDVGESIVCRRRYRILPDFRPGDRPYVVC